MSHQARKNQMRKGAPHACEHMKAEHLLKVPVKKSLHLLNLFGIYSIYSGLTWSHPMWPLQATPYLPTAPRKRRRQCCSGRPVFVQPQPDLCPKATHWPLIILSTLSMAIIHHIHPQSPGSIIFHCLSLIYILNSCFSHKIFTH